MSESISISSDHNGVSLKLAIKSYLENLGNKVYDFGCYSKTEPVDYPDYANAVISSVANCESKYGILICSTGTGMSIIANRHRKIRAALCHNVEIAQLAREHNNANILCLGAKYVTDKTAEKIIEQFLMTKFAGGRHTSRINKLAEWKYENY
ncbi:ribose 5-phosphate isomerase B [Candidatus Mesenet endosymbiont of Agriotes lineatus]|uniref:ribose 5-phosphate isomerase B n=1 Tax=Candidatus Mesenet endosymbiont of Agriotes lineatus TaxID=3077948 RepID=UPI0030D29DFF